MSQGSGEEEEEERGQLGKEKRSMKEITLFLVAAVAATVLAAPQADAKPTPAWDSECQGLEGVAFDLCRAYCDGLACGADDERRPCERLVHLFREVTDGSVPPCVAMCGDGEVNQALEECDDGNNESCDGCSFDCREEFCGDGILCGEEECEAGDVCQDGEACTDQCACPAPQTVPCSQATVPECGGECPSGTVCTDLDGILDHCECFF
jgi:cysteine-rich repeat protein